MKNEWLDFSKALFHVTKPVTRYKEKGIFVSLHTICNFFRLHIIIPDRSFNHNHRKEASLAFHMRISTTVLTSMVAF